MSYIRQYATIPYPPAPNIWDVVLEGPGPLAHRTSLDGLKVVVKWVGLTPAPLAAMAVTVLSHAEAVQLMATPEWSEAVP